MGVDDTFVLDLFARGLHVGEMLLGGDEHESFLNWKVAIDARVELGERPVWDEVSNTLVWVDINGGTIHRYSPQLGDEVLVDLGVSVGAVGLVRGGGYVAATELGFIFVDTSGRVLADPIRPNDMGDDVRFNDGACDPCGRFFAGTTAKDSSPKLGSLYRLNTDLSITTVIDEVTESNGIGWSPDGSIMYYVDSGEPNAAIRSFVFDSASGNIGSETKLVSAHESWGVPDGLVVDVDGCLWVAFWGGAALRRFSPLGHLLETYLVPVKYPTCPTFGGKDFTDLYVTTAWGDDDVLQRDANAGNVFLAVAPIAGRPAYRFGRPLR